MSECSSFSAYGQFRISYSIRIEMNSCIQQFLILYFVYIDLAPLFFSARVINIFNIITIMK